MKYIKFLSLVLLMPAISIFGQVQIDKSIDLNSATPANARIMGIKEVSGTQDAVSAEVLQKGTLVHASSVTGGPNAYTLGFSPAISTPYAQGMAITFKSAGGDNTGAVTINGIALRKDVSTALSGGEIKNGQIVTAAYDGSFFQLLSRTADATNVVPLTRTIATTAPLTGGGNLSADRTLAITQATTSSNGYLSSTDWNAFNAKESALTFSNGLTRSGNAITLGGSLTGNTTIAQTDKTLAFTSTVTNAFSVDGSTFSVDAANDRVGIGVTNPAHRLTVAANGQSNAAIGARAAAANTFEWGHGNTAGYGSTIGFQNGNGHPFIAFSAEAGTNNNTYRTRGLVGTVIKGDIAGGLSINSVANANADNQTLSPLVTVLTSGNVGIGSASTNPDRPLTIVGTGEWNIASRSTSTTSTNRNHILLQRANNTSAVTAGFNLGGIAMGGYDGSAYSYGWNGGAEVSAFANQTYTSTARGTYLSLFTTPDNTAGIKEQMRIGADGIISLTTGVNNIRGYLRAVESTEFNGANGGSGFVVATSGGETLTFKDGGVGGDVNMSINGVGTVTIPALGGSGNVPVYADNSGNLFKGPAAGSVVQMKAIQTRTQSTYATPISGNGVQITPLDIVVTPSKAGNAMVLQWVVNGETHHNHVYTVTRNGTLLTNATDGTVNKWSGVAAHPFDDDQNSSPSNMVISIIDFNTLSTSTTYAVHVRSSENASNFYLNRTVSSTGASQFENMLSTGTATEIQQ